jgi:CRISPR-associated endonuclease/helicase Cas3
MSGVTLLAHSANKDGKKQSFRDHTLGVTTLAVNNAKEVSHYISPKFRDLFINAVETAAYTHDFGKLDPEYEQPTYETGEKKYSSNHVDAGFALNWKNSHFTPALLTLAHHRGLRDFGGSVDKMRDTKRDKEKPFSNGKTQAEHTDANIKKYWTSFLNEIPTFKWLLPRETFFERMRPLHWRMALSCLIDADHTDTACHFLNETLTPPIPLNADFLKDNIIKYVDDLFIQKMSSTTVPEEKQRYKLRMDLFNECKNFIPGSNRIVYLPAPVGSGKSFAALACLLSVAKNLNLRRIFWVLPYTSIIDQGVQQATEALVASGVDPELIVTANHHKMDFTSWKHRHLAQNWKTQIIITTAVDFFETIASNKSRKLHYLCGSGVFCDEFHTLPMNLWKLSYQWIKELTKDFGCFFILGSGTFIRAWQLKEFKMDESIPSIVSPGLDQNLTAMEKLRVNYKRLGFIGINTLIKKICEHTTNTLIILSTVQNAAFVAQKLARKLGYDKVEHLSTSLHPESRRQIMARILNRLKNKENFVLVATSCVEAGMDFSFHQAYRESDCVESLIQTGGRINRNFEYSTASCYDFTFVSRSTKLTVNPMFHHDRQVLDDIFSIDKEVDFTKMTEYKQQRFDRECGIIIKTNELMLGLEEQRRFKLLGRGDDNKPQNFRGYKVIESQTITVLVNSNLVLRIQAGEKIFARELGKYCVHVYANKRAQMNIGDLIVDYQDTPLYYLKDPEINYDDFLGYMKGIL